MNGKEELPKKKTRLPPSDQPPYVNWEDVVRKKLEANEVEAKKQREKEK